MTDEQSQMEAARIKRQTELDGGTEPICPLIVHLDSKRSPFKGILEILKRQ